MNSPDEPGPQPNPTDDDLAAPDRLYPPARRAALRGPAQPVSPFDLAARAFARMRRLDTFHRPRNANFVLSALGRAAYRILEQHVREARGQLPWTPLAPADPPGEDLRETILTTVPTGRFVEVIRLRRGEALPAVAAVWLDALAREQVEAPDRFEYFILFHVYRFSIPEIAVRRSVAVSEVSRELSAARGRVVARLAACPAPAFRIGPHDLQRPLPRPWSFRSSWEWIRNWWTRHSPWFPP